MTIGRAGPPIVARCNIAGCDRVDPKHLPCTDLHAKGRVVSELSAKAGVRTTWFTYVLKRMCNNHCVLEVLFTHCKLAPATSKQLMFEMFLICQS